MTPFASPHDAEWHREQTVLLRGLLRSRLCVIPPDKRCRSQAMIDYKATRRIGQVSSLALSVMTGLLQSLLDASPSRMGQTFLRHASNVMHTPADDGYEFYTPTSASTCAR
jgi:hypothetical protein